MTYEEFKMSVLKTKPDGDIRFGQQAFNMLYAVRPDLANQVRGKMGLDPFYRNDNLYAFWLWLEERWDNAATEKLWGLDPGTFEANPELAAKLKTSSVAKRITDMFTQGDQ